jgi:hypothetical protein
MNTAKKQYKTVNNEQNRVKRLILKTFQAVIDFLMHKSGLMIILIPNCYLDVVVREN